MVEYKYKAFISYRREGIDVSAAEKLQRMLEQYIVPKDFRENHARKLGYIFRDKTHIDADPDLRGILYDALDSSEYLIVMCSGKIMDPEHPWVLEEIDHFLSMHPDARDKILTVLVADEPEEAIPKILYTEKTAPDGSVSQELPNYVDIRGKDPRQVLKHLRKQFFRIAATLLSCSTDGLAMRDKIRNRTKIASWIGGAAAVLAVIAGILMWSNWQLEARNNEILLRDSELLTQEGMEELEAGDRYSAIEKAVEALPGPNRERPLYAPAEQLLFSAMDPFQNQEQSYIFRQTVLEQNTEIKDYCINADGSLLTTADSFNTLTCFDTVTGAMLWRSSLFEKVVSNDPQVIFCERWDVVLFFNQRTIAGVSQRNGELLWEKELDRSWNNLFLLREEDGVFAFVQHRYSEKTNTDDLTLILCSAKDGGELSRIVLVSQIPRLQRKEDDIDYLYPLSMNKRHPVGCFSGDGRYFVGCYSSGDQRIHFFLADIQEQTCTTICSRDVDLGVSGIYYMAVTADDASVVVIREHPEDYGKCVAERISLHGGAVLWEQELDIKDSDCVAYATAFSMAVGFGKDLYFLDMDTGEIIDAIEMSDAIRDVYVKEHGIGCLTSNGLVSLGWRNGIGVSMFEGIADFGSCAKGQFWEEGNFRLQVENSRVTGVDVVDEDSGGGCAVMIPEEDCHRVVIQRPVRVPALLEKEASLYLPYEFESEYELAGENALVVYNIKEGKKDKDGYDTHRILILDPQTLEIQAEYGGQPWLSSDGVFFFKDGSGYIRDFYGEMILVDLRGGKQEVLCSTEEDTVFQVGGNSIKTRPLGSQTGRISLESDILTACVTQYGIKLWCNGSFLRDVVWPQRLLGADHTQMPDNISIGVNGMVLLAFPSEGDSWIFLAYEVFEDRWYRVDTDISCKEKGGMTAGRAEPVFLLLEANGRVSLYDIRRNELLSRFMLDFQQNSVAGMGMCLNEAYIYVLSKDTDMNVYEASSGKRVFRNQLPGNDTETLSFYEDPQRGYLFFCSGIYPDASYCVSTDSWDILTEISGLLAYNRYTGQIVQKKTEYSTEQTELWCTRMPTTEELVELAQEFLGN